MSATNERGMLALSGVLPVNNQTKVKAVLANIPVGTESLLSSKHKEVVCKLKLELIIIIEPPLNFTNAQWFGGGIQLPLKRLPDSSVSSLIQAG